MFNLRDVVINPIGTDIHTLSGLSQKVPVLDEETGLFWIGADNGEAIRYSTFIVGDKGAKHRGVFDNTLDYEELELVLVGNKIFQANKRVLKGEGIPGADNPNDWDFVIEYKGDFPEHSAFNKNFGINADEVARGNHSHDELHGHSNKSSIDKIGEHADGYPLFSNERLDSRWDDIAVDGRTHNVADWAEAIVVVESLNNKIIANRPYVVVLPAGTFTSTAVMNINSNRNGTNKLIIKGAGKGQTIIRNSDDSDVHIVDIRDSIVDFEGMTIDFEGKAKDMYIAEKSWVEFVAGTMEFKNCTHSTGSINLSDSYLYARETVFDNIKRGLRVSNFANANLRECVFNLSGESSIAITLDRFCYGYAYKAKINGDATDDTHSSYGVFINKSSQFYANYIEIKDVKTGIYIAASSLLESTHAKLTTIKEYGLRTYTNSFVDVKYIDITLTDYNSVRHFHIDKATVYASYGKHTNGQQIASLHYMSRFQFYNSPTEDLVDISYNTGEVDVSNYIELNGMSLLNDSGSDINCNVGNNSSHAMHGVHI